jgi:hypothetical protein
MTHSQHSVKDLQKDQQKEDQQKDLQKTLEKAGMWRASHLHSHLHSDFHSGQIQTTPTGFKLLDKQLFGAGWPTDGITELLYEHAGIGEVRLLAPALANLSQQQAGWILWISPPYVPYAPALASAGIDLTSVLIINPKNQTDCLWAMEQALASTSCCAVLAWPKNINDKQVRRLQVASKSGKSLGILFRSKQSAKQASPAELRIELIGTHHSPLVEHSSLDIKIIKRRGGWQTEKFTIEFDDKLHQITPDFSDMAFRNPNKPTPDLVFIDPQSSDYRHGYQLQ